MFIPHLCSRCSEGYYGNPLVPGNFCLPCDCHGNTDPMNLESCDRITGECKSCLGNTEGYHCERCIEGYFGTAENGDCVKCECDPLGSLSTLCDHSTGQCQCRARYSGRDCSECEVRPTSLHCGQKEVLVHSGIALLLGFSMQVNIFRYYHNLNFVSKFILCKI